VDEADENLQFFRVYCALKDNEGNLYIMENGNKRIQKFDADWKYLLTIGSEGQGPGEFASPTMMDIDLESKLLYVSDMGNGMISSFDFYGEYKNSIRLEQFQMITSIRTLGNGELLTRLISFMPPQEDKKESLLCVFNENGNIVREFGELITHEIDIISRLINNIYFETDNSKNIYVSFQYENRIEKYTREGDLVMVSDRPLNFAIEHKMVKRTVNFRGSERVIDSPDLTRTSGNLCVDENGRIWISTYQAQAVLDDAGEEIEKRKIALEIFDKDGILLGRIPYPEENFAFLKIQGESVFFSGDEYTSVYEYRIVEK